MYYALLCTELRVSMTDDTPFVRPKVDWLKSNASTFNDGRNILQVLQVNFHDTTLKWQKICSIILFTESSPRVFGWGRRKRWRRLKKDAGTLLLNN